MIVRPLEEGDMVSCSKLFAQEFNLPPWNDKWTDEQAIVHLREVSRFPKSAGLVAERDGSVVGMLLGHQQQWWSGVEFVIDEMCVSHLVQRQGIGTLLLRELKVLLATQGILTMILWTIRSSAAIDFYISQGFAEMADRLFFHSSVTE